MHLSKKEKAIQKIRTKRYGQDFTRNHQNLGLIWTGILQSYYEIQFPEMMPSHVVLLMMAASKINRASTEKGKLLDEENYDDGKIYLELAKSACKNYKTIHRK